MLNNRQVDVILQNNTQELLTVESHQTYFGVWAPLGAPKIGTVVTKQGSAKWSTISDIGEYDVGAYIRLGSTKGYIAIDWQMPKNAAAFKRNVQVPPVLHCLIKDIGPNSDYRVVVVTLLSGPEPCTAARK